MKYPRVTATICGAAWPIPNEAWDELLALPFGVDDPEATRLQARMTSAAWATRACGSMSSLLLAARIFQPPQRNCERSNRFAEQLNGF